MKLVLASASPRRAELLTQIGLKFEIHAVDIDETPLVGELAEEYVTRLAINKAHSINQQTDTVVLGSDTTVVINGEILGKPSNKQDTLRMLRLLSNNTHQVLTSVAVTGEHTSSVVSKSFVTFAKISEKELEWYWSTGEPKGKAGAYAIQGKAAVFITRLEGSYSGVMGLPLHETKKLLAAHGITVD